MTDAPYLRRSQGLHPTIDSDALRRVHAGVRDDVWNISSPAELVPWERLRERHALAAAAQVPCDLFFWGIGTPPHPRMTRIGGVPWLPKGVEWPRTSMGCDGGGTRPMTFLAQFNFEDSTDLVPDLPGDVLLLFVADHEYLLGLEYEQDGLALVWAKASDAVIEAGDVPGDAVPFPFCAYGVRYRSFDLPSTWDRAYELSEEGIGTGRTWALPVLWATKIGGVPYASQDRMEEVPPEYLCQLVSVQPGQEEWPFVDHPERIEVHDESNMLLIGDLGEMTVFVGSDGRARVDSACG